MRLMVIGDDSALHARLRNSVEVRWLQSEVVEYNPVLRGSFILENLLGTPPAPPPPNVEAFQENKEGEQSKTIRQIMETHRANPSRSHAMNR